MSDMRVAILSFGFCLLLAPSAKADECDAIVGNIIAQVPGLTLDKRTPVEGSSDIVYLKHAQAKELSIFCPEPGVPWPALNDDWPNGLPPASYFQLIGQMGSVMTGVSADLIRAGAMKCQQIALAAKNEIGDLDSDGITFECSAFTRDGGSTTMTLAKHRPEK